jgi:sirohydrochlorin ferrochelatase
VRLAFLSPATPDLDQTIREEIAAGARDIDILALLLSSGGKHMQHDVPRMLDVLRGEFPQVTLRLHGDALGSTPEAIAAMAVAAERILK